MNIVAQSYFNIFQVKILIWKGFLLFAKIGGFHVCMFWYVSEYCDDCLMEALTNGIFV